MKNPFFENRFVASYGWRGMAGWAISAVVLSCLVIPAQAQRRGHSDRGGSHGSAPSRDRDSGNSHRRERPRFNAPSSHTPRNSERPRNNERREPRGGSSKGAPARTESRRSPRSDSRQRSDHNAQPDRNNARDERRNTPPANNRPQREKDASRHRPSSDKQRDQHSGRHHTPRPEDDGKRPHHSFNPPRTPDRPKPPDHAAPGTPPRPSSHVPHRPRRPVSSHPKTPRRRRPDHRRPPVKVYIPYPVYQWATPRVYYYSYSDSSSLWPMNGYESNNYYTHQNYYRYDENHQYQNNELGSFQGEVSYYGDDDWFEYKANNKTWEVVLLHEDTVHPEEGDYVQVIGYVVDDVIYAEHVRILKSEYEYD